MVEMTGHIIYCLAISFHRAIWTTQGRHDVLAIGKIDKNK